MKALPMPLIAVEGEGEAATHRYCSLNNNYFIVIGAQTRNTAKPGTCSHITSLHTLHTVTGCVVAEFQMGDSLS